jgi:hypothetical protein
MMRLRALAWIAVASLPALACSLNLDRGEEDSIARNECSSNSDCGPGECWLGACVAHDAELGSVLLEIAPPKGAVGASVGGLRFLKTLSDLAHSSSDNVIDLQPATEVVGSLLAQPGACGKSPRSFPVEVTFTPREDSFGLPVVSYTARTSRGRVGEDTRCRRELEGIDEVDQFSVWVPSGSYDVYVKPLPPADDEADPECTVVPQLIRGTPFISLVETCLPIPFSTPERVSVAIPWSAGRTGEDSLDGWKIDLVHPITGHVLSSPALLSDENRTKTATWEGYRRDVLYTPVPPGETVKELIRLTPPAGVVAPVIQADRTGLQVASSEATFPQIGPFPPPVKLGGWVAPEGTIGPPDRPIPGRVVFTALSLKGIKPGVFASHSTTAVVGPEGDVTAEVLPGEYRLRVVPEVGTRYAATETSEKALCQTKLGSDLCIPRGTGEPQSEQFGTTFAVKPAAALSGVVVDSGSGGRVGQVSVDALPAFVSTRSCANDPSNVACAVAPVGVLDLALGDGAFVPRGVSGIVQSGMFRLTGLDCGECTEDSGALFDVLVKPPEESRRAWGLKPGIKVVSGEVGVGDIELTLPVIHRGTIEIRQSPRVTVKRALLRAYVLRDETGSRIEDPTGLPSCTMLASSGVAAPSTRCIRSVLQVAETTSDDEGHFELVLPSRIKEIE